MEISEDWAFRPLRFLWKHKSLLNFSEKFSQHFIFAYFLSIDKISVKVIFFWSIYDLRKAQSFQPKLCEQFVKAKIFEKICDAKK
jgi:hypothetical protein